MALEYGNNSSTEMSRELLIPPLKDWHPQVLLLNVIRFCGYNSEYIVICWLVHITLSLTLIEFLFSVSLSFFTTTSFATCHFSILILLMAIYHAVCFSSLFMK